jgi:hypothetical protein
MTDLPYNPRWKAKRRKKSSCSFESIKEKANLVRSIDLVAVLDVTGAVKDKFDKAKWHTQQGTISICGPKFMNWSTGRGGGGAIDLVMHIKDFDFKTAVLWLAATFPAYDIQKPSRLKCYSKPILQLPKKDNTRISKVIHYLVNTRSIPLSIIKPLIHSGKLYADTRGNAVFLLLGKEKRVVGAELRGTHQTRWHGMAPGSRKDLGFFLVKNSHSGKIMLCESAIDALSFLALYPSYLAISTSGATTNPAWLRSFINNEYEIYCGFDSDETGDKLAEKMITIYPTIRRLRPQKHDWNEVLISQLKR